MIIKEEDLNKLISTWEKRAENHLQTEDYKLAVNECLYDLHNLICKAKEEEAYIIDCIANLPTKEEEDYIKGLEADVFESRHTA